jgi:hypothetical protein
VLSIDDTADDTPIIKPTVKPTNKTIKAIILSIFPPKKNLLSFSWAERSLNLHPCEIIALPQAYPFQGNGTQ